MNVHDTIKAKIQSQPALHSNRYAVLTFMFMGVQGADWVGGELTNTREPSSAEKKTSPRDTVQEEYQWKVDQFYNSPRVALEAFNTGSRERWVMDEASLALCPLRPERHESMWTRSVATVARVLETRKDMEAAVESREMPECSNVFEDYTPLMNIPDDITDDWLGAAEEMCVLLETLPTYRELEAIKLQEDYPAPDAWQKNLIETYWQTARPEMAQIEASAKSLRERIDFIKKQR